MNAPTQIQPFTRTFIAGTVPAYHYRTGQLALRPLWITVEFELSQGKHRLSITGVHGPMSNGDCHGSSGQCTDTLQELIDGPEENITLPGGREAAIKLADIWRDWHLNDMRAHCEHQKAVHNWDLLERLTIWKWKLDAPTILAQRKVKQEAERLLLEGEAAQYTQAELELLNLPYWAYTYTDAAPSERYKADGAKSAAACHVYPLEAMKPGAYPGPDDCHPRGLLTKPCPTCGHKYGSALLYTDVPADVLEFLAGLPDQSESYLWER